MSDKAGPPGTSPATEQLYASYKDRVHFYMIYVREAHPLDGWVMPNNAFKIQSPKSTEARQKIAQAFAEKIHVTIPILVDGINDHVEQTYACWPNRMYILDAQGKIVDKGAAGPGGVSASARRAAETLDKFLVTAK